MTHDEALKLANTATDACDHGPRQADHGPCLPCTAAAIEKACAEVARERNSAREMLQHVYDNLDPHPIKATIRQFLKGMGPLGTKAEAERDQLQAQLVELQRIFHAETEAKATIAKHKDQLQAQVADLKTHLTTEESDDTHRQEQELIQQLQAQVGALRAELDAFVYYSNDADNYYWRPNANSRSGGVGISLYRLLRDTASAAQAFEDRIRKETLEALLEDVRVYFGKELPPVARRFSEPTPPETKRCNNPK